MPTGNLATSQDVAIRVPAVCVRRVRAEALGELSMSAENVSEAARWHESGEDSTRLDADELPRLEAAADCWRQVTAPRIGDDLIVRGPVDVVGSLLRCCMRSAADDLRDHLEGDWSPSEVRVHLAEIEGWAGVFADSKVRTGQGRRGA